MFWRTPTDAAHCKLVCEAKIMGKGMQKVLASGRTLRLDAGLDGCDKILLTNGKCFYVYQRTPDGWTDQPVGYVNLLKIRERHVCPIGTDGVRYHRITDASASGSVIAVQDLGGTCRAFYSTRSNNRPLKTLGWFTAGSGNALIEILLETRRRPSRFLPACPSRRRRRQWSCCISAATAASVCPGPVPARPRSRSAPARSPERLAAWR